MYGMGWIPDRPDQRDFKLETGPFATRPTKVDLRSQCSPVVDQGELGSCTANAIAGALEFDVIKQGKPFIPLSRLFIYYNERVIEHTVNSDAGAMIRDGMKSVAKQGVCPEQDWSYDINRFAQKPTTLCYQEGLKEQAYTYRSVTNSLGSVQLALAVGYPVVFGFTVYESFMTQQVANSGVMPMPQRSEQVVGGHAVLAVGYDNDHQIVIVRNSWGTNWGASGYFFMPAAYFHSGLTSDLWTITKVE